MNVTHYFEQIMSRAICKEPIGGPAGRQSNINWLAVTILPFAWPCERASPISCGFLHRQEARAKMTSRRKKVCTRIWPSLMKTIARMKRAESTRRYGANLSGFIADANTSATPSLDLEACGLGSVHTSPSRLGITFFSFLYSSLKCIIAWR